MRIYENLNNNWFFSKDQFENIPIEITSNWEDISLPHTWNCFDGQDGGADYYRGKCWYIKELTITKQQKEKELYLEFNAVSAYCRVYLNGIQVGEHKGGYSTFRIPITEFVREGKNILSVMVSNEALSDIYPQMADFTFYGGIYRDVKMITVEKTHFDLDYYGGNGIQLQSEITGKNNAFLRIYGFITNPCESDQMLFRMYDSQQKEIVTAVQPATENTFLELQLSDLILWQGIENPYLYQMELLLLRHNEVIDEVHIPYGVAGVLGNNDYERCTEDIRKSMAEYGMHLLEHQNDTVRKDDAFIIISGVRNPFDLKRNGVSPSNTLHDDDFVILLTHTPDYVEEADVRYADLALAGHTHGGQVSFLRIWTPETGSHYGTKLLTGKKTSSKGLPVIITNGLGTSRIKMRMCAPSEIVEIVLHRK